MYFEGCSAVLNNPWKKELFCHLLVKCTSKQKDMTENRTENGLMPPPPFYLFICNFLESPYVVVLCLQCLHGCIFNAMVV